MPTINYVAIVTTDKPTNGYAKMRTDDKKAYDAYLACVIAASSNRSGARNERSHQAGTP